MRENKTLRREVEAGIEEANRHMAVARSVMQDEVLSVALMIPKQEMHLEIEEKDIMSVRIPVYRTQLKTADENDIFPYATPSPPETWTTRCAPFRRLCRRCSGLRRWKILPAYGGGDRED